MNDNIKARLKAKIEDKIVKVLEEKTDDLFDKIDQLD